MGFETLASIFSEIGGGLTQFGELKRKLREEAARQKLLEQQIAAQEFENQYILPEQVKKIQAEAEWRRSGGASGRYGRAPGSLTDAQQRQILVDTETDRVRRKMIELGIKPTYSDVAANYGELFDDVDETVRDPILKSLGIRYEKPTSDRGAKGRESSLTMKGAGLAAKLAAREKKLATWKNSVAYAPNYYDQDPKTKEIRFNPSGQGRFTGTVTPEMAKIGYKAQRLMPEFVEGLGALEEAESEANAVLPMLEAEGISAPAAKISQTTAELQRKRLGAQKDRISAQYKKYDADVPGLSTSDDFLSLSKEERDLVIAAIPAYRKWKSENVGRRVDVIGFIRSALGEK